MESARPLISSRSSSLMALVMPPGTPGAGMDAPTADDLDDAVAGLAGVDDLAADLGADLLDHAEDVALGLGGIRPHDQVRSAEHVEVRGVVGHVEGVVEQLAQHAPGARRRHVVDGVGGLGRGHVVCLRADAADAVGQRRHVLHRSAHAEGLEAAQLGDLEVGVLDVPGVVEEDLDLAVTLQTCDGIDGDACHDRPP